MSRQLPIEELLTTQVVDQMYAILAYEGDVNYSLTEMDVLNELETKDLLGLVVRAKSPLRTARLLVLSPGQRTRLLRTIDYIILGTDDPDREDST